MWPLVAGWLGRNLLWLVLLALAAVGWGSQALRVRSLDSQLERSQAATATAVGERDAAAARANTLAGALETSERRRREDQATAEKAQEEADAATKRTQETSAAARAAGDAHERAVRRLRIAFEAATSTGAGDRGGAGGAAAPGGGQAADQAVGVLAALLERCGADARDMARFADDAHDAAVAGWNAWPVSDQTTPPADGPR